jgi:hypothetical protein
MMTLKVIGFSLLGIVAIYVLWIAFVPMLVGQKIVERKVLENSPQYVITQRSAILELYTSYTAADDAHQAAIKTQMCEIAHNIPQSEWPREILTVCE